MGCCCSSCREPDIERSINLPHIKQHRHHRLATRSPAAQQTQQQAPPSNRAVDLSGSPPVPDDEPPPYDSNAVQGTQQSRAFGDTTQSGESGSQEPKELPYVIPLTSAGTGTRSEDSLAAAYASDMQSFGVPASDYTEFLAGLDRGLFASPTAQPGSVSAYIHSMFQDQATSQGVTWHSTTSADSISRSRAYVAAKNAEIFHRVSLHVEVLGTEDMRRRIDAVSLLKIRGDRRLDEIEAQRNEEKLKLEQKLLTSKTLEKQQKAMRKFLEKDEKYNRKALKAISHTEQQADEEDTRAGKHRAEQSNDGVYWLLVTRYDA